MNDPDLIIMSFAVFEDFNPTLAKKFRLAGWTGPVRVELGDKAYGHAPFVERQMYARLRWDGTETNIKRSDAHYTDPKGRRWPVDEKGRVHIEVL